jgi:hypothetical protein
MERVQNGKQNEAKALLDESFKKQMDGTFNAEYLKGFMPKMMKLLKPESMAEVKTIMSQFGQGNAKP